MIQVVNQFRRIFSDDGRGDKDFSQQEARLREVQRQLHKATEALKSASETLIDLIQAKNYH